MSQHLWAQRELPCCLALSGPSQPAGRKQRKKRCEKPIFEADITLFIFMGNGSGFFFFFRILLFYFLFCFDLVDFCLVLFETGSYYVSLAFLELAT